MPRSWTDSPGGRREPARGRAVQLHLGAGSGAGVQASHCGCDGKDFKAAAHSALIKANLKLKPFPVWEKQEETSELIVRCGGERKVVEFLWPGMLPKGKLIHFAEVSSEGKSPVTMDLSGRITSGTNWPDGQLNTFGKCSVLMLNIEDDYNDTILPRLDLAGGDDSKFFYVQGTRFTRDDKTSDRGVALDRDVHLLLAEARKHEDLAVIFIDPITNYLGARKMNSEEDVRSILTPLADIARDLNVAVITTGHLNRRETGSSPLFRVMGASAFVGVARSIYMFGPDPNSESEHDHIMVPARNCTCVGNPKGMKYSTYLGNEKTIPAVDIRWGETTSARASDAVDPATHSEKGKIAKPRRF